jgi:hypothetical protein
MAGPNLLHHAPIVAVQTISGNTDNTAAINEKNGQTFLAGTPVQISNLGFIQAWPGTGGGVAEVIAGITLIDGSNLATSGAGAPTPFTGIGFPGTSTTFGSVPNEPSAVNIPRGAPFSTGQTLFNKAIGDTIFEAMFDNSTGNVAADWTPTQADIGVQYGLTADGTAPVYWYVDKAKATPGTNTVLIIVNLDPIDGSIPNGRVQFKFLASASQYLQ